MINVIFQKTQEAHNKQIEGEIHKLFKFAQGVAHLWDVHELGLAKQERSLQEKLEECRHNHDYCNQVGGFSIFLISPLRKTLDKVL